MIDEENLLGLPGNGFKIAMVIEINLYNLSDNLNNITRIMFQYMNIIH